MPEVSTKELKNMQARGGPLTLINVLPAEKFESTKIAGATSIPLEDGNFAARVERAAGGKGERVVVYCSNDECPLSTKAAEVLKTTGFTNVDVYKGGAQAWQDSQKASVANT